MLQSTALMQRKYVFLLQNAHAALTTAPAGPMGTPALCSSNSGPAAASSVMSVNEALCSWSAYCTYLALMRARNIFSCSEAIANSVKCPRELLGKMRHNCAITNKQQRTNTADVAMT
ncbi:hypothetical protein COO60DRAFT_1592415, partial [Scenedesmus sp. NREL 46B-D3]